MGSPFRMNPGSPLKKGTARSTGRGMSPVIMKSPSSPLNAYPIANNDVDAFWASEQGKLAKASGSTAVNIGTEEKPEIDIQTPMSSFVNPHNMVTKEDYEGGGMSESGLTDSEIKTQTDQAKPASEIGMFSNLVNNMNEKRTNQRGVDNTNLRSQLNSGGSRYRRGDSWASGGTDHDFALGVGGSTQSGRYEPFRFTGAGNEGILSDTSQPNVLDRYNTPPNEHGKPKYQFLANMGLGMPKGSGKTKYSNQKLVKGQKSYPEQGKMTSGVGNLVDDSNVQNASMIKHEGRGGRPGTGQGDFMSMFGGVQRGYGDSGDLYGSSATPTNRFYNASTSAKPQIVTKRAGSSNNFYSEGSFSSAKAEADRLQSLGQLSPGYNEAMKKYRAKSGNDFGLNR